MSAATRGATAAGRSRFDPMDSSETLSFVIPTLNEEAYLPACLHSLGRLELPPGIRRVETIVVDTGSADATAAIARRFNARVLSADGASTIAAARNLGAREATGAWLGFVDADVELDPQWLILAFEHFSCGGVAAFGTGLGPPLAGATWVERTWYELAHARSTVPFLDAEWLATFNLLVPRTLFETVRGFNADLATCEDTDFSYRLAAHGRLVLENRVGTRHLRESKTLHEFFRRELWRGRNNLKSFIRHRPVLSEFYSLAAPAVFVAGLAGVPLLLLVPSGWRVFRHVLEVLALAAVCIPGFIVIRRGVSTRRLSLLAAGYVLAVTYVLARGLAVFWPSLGRYTARRSE